MGNFWGRLRTVLCGAALVLPVTGYSAPGSLANEPLFIASTVEPNVMFNLDDSGSMIWEITPDDIMGGGSVMYLFKPGDVKLVEDTNYDFTSLYGLYRKPSYTTGCGNWLSGLVGIESTHCINEYVYDNVASTLHGHWYTAYTRSPQINQTAYNPRVRYLPWVKADGSNFPDAPPSEAPNRPGFEYGSRDLTSFQTETANFCTDKDGDFARACGGKAVGSGSGFYQSTQTYWPAMYYEFSGDRSDPASYRNAANYKPIIIAPPSDQPVSLNNTNGAKTAITGAEHYTYPKYEGRDDCAANPCTYEEEIQNFANWYSYSRSRILASRGGIGRAFVNQPDWLRVGYTSINSDDVIMGVRPFQGANKTSFYEELYETNIGGATPLRRSMDQVGQYFTDTSAQGAASATGPWADDPVNGVLGDDLSCRPNYHILMTDGYWNTGASNAAETAGARLNVDNTDGPTHVAADGTSYTYAAVSPFSDSYEDTLADAAMYYWKNDLRPHASVSNNVPTVSGSELGPSNPAFWQHLVTYGVGLGVTGTIDPQEAFKAIDDSSVAINWPDPLSSNAAKIDDLLHAAVNSRGGFFSASDPVSFASELAIVLNRIVATTGSSTGITFNTATLETETLLFGARFDSTRWSGELFALGIQEGVNGGPPTINENSSWEAGELLDARNLTANPRQIITSGTSGGQPFNVANWDALTPLQRQDLSLNGDAQLGQDRLRYLRGESIEGMRVRDSRLGDIVNSSPVYVQNANLNWPLSTPAGSSLPFGVSGNTYADFRKLTENRDPVVYVGANAGMFHAFSAQQTAAAGGGQELFAYVPSFVASTQPDNGLHYLTRPTYQHRFYADLSPVVSDVYISASSGGTEDWRTILIGGARAGARGIFALDVTNPGSFSEANASQMVLWEFTSDDDAKMGYIMDPPVIGVAQWGADDYRWTAFFGNGYNSGSGATGLFMLDLEGGLDGNWGTGDYRFISMEASGGTGLSSIRAVDLTGNRVIDRVYGGDLKGQMWAIENSSGTWGSAYTQGGANRPLFTAVRDGKAQPITSAPMVIRNPESGTAPNLIVLFGTGQYLANGDPANADVQSFYGVFDRNTGRRDRSNLKARTLSDTALTVEGVTYDVRTSTGQDLANNDSGWYVDFTTESGERIVQSPQVRGRYVFVNSIIPSDDRCEVGGGGWLMAFGLDGRTPDRAVFTRFSEAVVGYRVRDGLPNRPGFLGDFMFTPKSDDTIVTDEIDVGRDAPGIGRVSWQELYD